MLAGKDEQRLKLAALAVLALWQRRVFRVEDREVRPVLEAMTELERSLDEKATD
jgi:hypothetical protein